MLTVGLKDKSLLNSYFSTSSNSEFKYHTPIRFYNGRRVVYNYNSDLSQDFGRAKNLSTTEGTGLSKFFIDYHSHSLQLIDALKEWANRIRFTSCKYEGGFFNIEDQKPIESMNHGFMRYMKKHLEKEEEYQQKILTLIIKIETDHKQLCGRIENIIASNISYRPSFQKLIIDKIESSCPKLTETNRTDLEENNIYIKPHIFKLIFGKILNNESAIILEIVPSSISNSSVLVCPLFALAQGESSDMDRLKTVMERLVTDIDIKKRVDEYVELEKELTGYEKIDELKNMIDELWTFIHGGGYLGGIDACQLCDPSKLAPV